MNINPISFGKKIPVAKCKVQDKNTGKFIPATFYEYDCKDESDFLEIKNLSRKWTFKKHIANNMEIKHAVETFWGEKSNSHFYVMEDANKEILGICQVDEKNEFYNIDYIESKPYNKYKYVGQSMIASIGRKLLKNKGQVLLVRTPVDDAMDFYLNLGFTPFGDFMFKMLRPAISKLVHETEEKTNTLDLNV